MKQVVKQLLSASIVQRVVFVGVCCWACDASIARAQAQPPEPSLPRSGEQRVGGVPSDVATQAVALWNSTNTRRVRGDFSLASGDTVRGDVAVLGGHARVAGVVTGQLLALNGGISLMESGHVNGTLTVIGGAFDSPARPSVGGEIRVWAARLRYRQSGDSLIADVDREPFAQWSGWRRNEHLGPHSELFLASAHTYNRVEGLPVYFGPRYRNGVGDTRFNVELLGVFRTGDRLRWARQNLGHRALVEIQQGATSGVRVGGRLFDEVDAVEQWQLDDTEVGLSSFLFTRDYRDYWLRHGAAGYVSLFSRGGTQLRAEYGAERWSTRNTLNVWSIFNEKDAWRPNPEMDEGVLHIATLTGRLDTRNSVENPRSGWLLFAQWERGDGTLDRLAPTTPNVRATAAGHVEYTRGLVDLRRYNRLAPGAQLNVRAVLGGWIDGNALPLQRRFSVSGIDALPGFDFRRTLGASDVGTCATGNDASYVQLGRPAQCERMILLQAEWKGDFRVRLFGDRDWFGDRRWATSHFSADGSWVVFANSGRGWLVNGNDASLRYASSAVPDIGTWRSDIGGGVDFGNFGVYFAQAVSQSGLKPNVYVRLGHRF